MMPSRLAFAVALLALSLKIHPAVAAAESPEAQSAGNALDEIVVTAQKRSESIQSVPVSITLVTGDELTRTGVQSISDLANLSSAVEFTSISSLSPGTGAFIRGIGTETVGGSTATGSVSMVLDGVTMGNTSVGTLFDVNHVEILKGPQGTLFGSSNSAGVINVVTNAPDPAAMSLQANLEYGAGSLGSEYSRTSLRGVVNLPLTDTSAIRLAVHADDNSGVFNNVYLGAQSSEPDNGVRIRYLAHPTEDLTVNLAYDYSKAEHNNYPSLTYRYAPSTPPYDSLSTALSQCGVTPGSGNFDFCSGVFDSLSQLDRGGSLQLDWRIGDLTLTSITADRKRDNVTSGNIEGLPQDNGEANFSGCLFFNCLPIYALYEGNAHGGPPFVSQKRHQLSEELRLASSSNKHFEWIAGLYYNHYTNFDNEPGATVNGFTGVTTTDITDYWADVKTEEYAGFANGTYYFTDYLRGLAGLRYTHAVVNESQYYPTNFGNENVYSRDTSENKVTWRAGLQADVAKHTMVYAVVSTGFKAQQIADAFIAPDGQLGAEVLPEEPTNYEVGIKTSLFDDRLAIDADVFYTQVKNFQGQNCVPDPILGIKCEPTNVPAVDSKGIELDVFGRPIQNLTVNLSASYNPAQYPEGYTGTDGLPLGGEQLEYVSKFKATLSVEHTLPINATYSFISGLDYTYRSEQRVYTSSSPWFLAPASNVFNARLGVASAKNWSAYIFGRNLGSERFPRQIYPVPYQYGPPGEPGGLWNVLDASSKRLVGFQLEAKF
jgi:iron complex outermembrane receptor protein